MSCSPSDWGVECVDPHDSRFFPSRLLLFDRHPGGIGLAQQVVGREGRVNSRSCLMCSHGTSTRGDKENGGGHARNQWKSVHELQLFVSVVSYTGCAALPQERDLGGTYLKLSSFNTTFHHSLKWIGIHALSFNLPSTSFLNTSSPQACPLFTEILSLATDLVAKCPCVMENGCPGCVQV